MAIRIDASGDYVRRTVTLPSDTLFTMTGWVYLVSDRTGQYRYFAGMENSPSSASEWKLIGWNNSNQFVVETSNSRGIFSASPVNGEWFFFALVGNGTGAESMTGYYIKMDGTIYTVIVDNSSAISEAVLYLGNDSYDEWNNIRLANILVYDAALTQAEIVSQMWKYTPQRIANLHAWWPMFGGATERLLDYSGNGRNLTAGGTLTDEAGPPVPWGIWTPPLPIFAVAAGGTTYNQSVSGAFTPSGVLLNQVQKVLGGGITPSAILLNQTQKILNGNVTPIGAILNQGQKILSGSFTSTGALTNQTQKVLSGTLTPLGQLLNQAQKVLSGNVTPSGILATAKTALISLVGSLTPSGTLTKETQKALSGTITPTGSILKQIGKLLSGALTPIGALVASLVSTNLESTFKGMFRGMFRRMK